MPKEKNIQIVNELKENFKKAKSVIFVDYLGLSAQDVNEFRQKMKDEGATVVVAKNTLMKKAVEEDGSSKDLEKDLEGPTMAVFSYSDPVSPIKTIFEFAKTHELPKTKSALVEGKYKSSIEVEELKDVPSKEELLGRFVGSLGSPISKFVYSLGGIQNKFVFAISAVAKKKS